MPSINWKKAPIEVTNITAADPHIDVTIRTINWKWPKEPNIEKLYIYFEGVIEVIVPFKDPEYTQVRSGCPADFFLYNIPSEDIHTETIGYVTFKNIPYPEGKATYKQQVENHGIFILEQFSIVSADKLKKIDADLKVKKAKLKIKEDNSS
ncbi:hypothetical protein [Flavilitoribacter nigricans]|uniref:Uncharacterized protein n=1 Tax=Flavilitoribacter nigricans (strain ATCC 23147 / DSM 23189 / NBRC 102662 / NCIMB 1420 / SS-2) TaxID=1122177 RepID=A0A2D0NCI5_FLAN2|nr:hypothetical protein [Flavilitoribacter nigricans]PHN06205.1 hypothetical protein CRP01_11525 [Flavilitoribacter nigricans DSM 23189 = NBRC 102662]